MESEKNLHATIPAALLVEAEKAASADHISVDELVREALERRLRERHRQNLYAYGEGQARKLGIKEEDVDRIIHEFRMPAHKPIKSVSVPKFLDLVDAGE